MDGEFCRRRPFRSRMISPLPNFKSNRSWTVRQSPSRQVPLTTPCQPNCRPWGMWATATPRLGWFLHQPPSGRTILMAFPVRFGGRFGHRDVPRSRDITLLTKGILP